MIRTSTIGLGIFAFVSSANAETVAEFYKGKTVDLYISTSTGGGYDFHRSNNGAPYRQIHSRQSNSCSA